MKTRPLATASVPIVFPARLFHASLSGLLLGTALTLWLHHAGDCLGQSAPGTGTPPPTVPVSSPTPVPGTPAGIPTPDDSDGDGIPNAWEIQFHHNPNDPADAAADFDNDGLSALQEYQLYTRTAGAAGNPLGQWSVKPLEPPAEFTGCWFYPVAINHAGDVLVQASGGNPYRYLALLVTHDGTWTKLVSNDKPTWNSYGSDLNDQQQVVGQRYANDWSTWESFIWDPVGGFKTLQYQGKKAMAYKVNNHGDWMGSIIEPTTGEYKQAWVVGGQNQVASQDWWPYSWLTDLNDAGEAMGSYCNPFTGRSQTFLAYGSWRYDTGFAGSQPMFDDFTNVWSWASAMNSQGEFTGSGGGAVGNQWQYLGYHFDGSFTPLRFNAQAMSSINPEDLNSAGTIVGYASSYPADSGGFVSRDGIGLFLHQLPLGIGPCYSAKINDAGTILATDQATGKILTISPDQDADGDGMSDDWEIFHNLNPNDPSDAFADPDNDGINNLGKFMLRTNPNVFNPRGASGQLMDTRPGIDTDGDGMPNTWEWANGLDFEDPSDALLDSDRDGFTNLQEYQLNTDPRGAPSFRIREIGPFPDTSYVNLSTATLGRGQSGGAPLAVATGSVTESAYFYATPANTNTQGNCRPAAWSIQRTQNQGCFSLYPSHGSQYLSPVAMADTGAALASHSYNPVTLVYWASPSANPVSISGAVPTVGNATAADVRSLSSARLSPSGTWLVGWRTLHSTGVMQPVLWKMPAANQIFMPMPLTVPTGLTLSSGAPLQVNDAGVVAATAMQAGYNRAVLWKLNGSGQPSPIILPPHSGGTWSSVSGLSNTSNPVVAGSATLANGQRRATVWNNSGMPIDLGTLESGNDSCVTVVSPSGLVAGISRVFDGTGYGYKSFLAKPAPLGSASLWKVFPQGTAAASVTHTLLTDAGELLGSCVPVYRQPAAPTLWRLGRAYPLDSILPASSGFSLISILGLNPNGSLLVSAWRGSYQARLLLTPDADADGDGLPDAYENLNHFNPYRAQPATTDTDNDGLCDLLEYRNGTDPRRLDSDGDGMNDAWEIQWGFNPLDPTDAAADADGDHVSNLREAQLGTNPVGVFRTQVLYTDYSNAYPYPCAFDDSGRVLISQYQYSSKVLANGWQSSTSTTTSSLLNPNSAQLITQLPVASGYSSEYNPDGSQYNSVSLSQTFKLDAASGAVHCQVSQYRYAYDGRTYQTSEARSFIPDVMAPGATNPATWISWDAVKAQLTGTAGTLNNYPLASSPDGSRSLYQDTAGNYYLLDSAGNRIWWAPPASSVASGRYCWQLLNSQGHAVATKSTWLPAANGLPAYSKYEIQYWNGTTVATIPVPSDWNIASTSIYIQTFSEDGLALIQRSLRNPDGSYSYEFHFLNLASQAFTRVSTPGAGYESIQAMSPRNGRMVGYGSKPFMVTPGGTCVCLDSLRIRNSSSAPEQSLASLFPNGIFPRYITSDGRITFTTTDTCGRQAIVQVNPGNDLNGNGIPDDWEKHWAAICLDTLGEANLTPSELAMLRAGNLDPNARIAGCDMSVMQIYQASGTAGSGIIPQGDAALYTVELEVTRESRTIGSGVGFLPLNDPENTSTRFLEFEEESRLTIKNSPNFDSNAVNLLTSLTKSTFFEAGRILNECKITTEANPLNCNWEATHRKTLPSTVKIEWGTRVDTNLNELSATRSVSGSGSSTPWRLTDSYGHTLAMGTEIIERSTIIRLAESRTVQEVFAAMNACSPWETNPDVHHYSPSGYASQLYSSCSNNPTGYDRAVQAVRKEYEDGAQLSERISDTDVSWYSWHASAHRLKSLRYRWLKFNPTAPFAHFACAPPAAYSKKLSLLLTRDRYKSSGIANAVDHTIYHESEIIGVESLVFKGGTNGWTDADITPLQAAKYQITAPDDLPAASYDVASNASTSVLVQPIKLDIAVDANRDGLITFDGKDETSAEKPFVFWVNDDHDVKHPVDLVGAPIPATLGQEDIFDGIKDCEDEQIRFVRDLEDFTRLHLYVGLNAAQILDGTISVGLEFTETTGNPSIKVYRAREDDGGMRYILANTTGEAQLSDAKYNTALGTVCAESNFRFPNTMWDTTLSSSSKAYLIFEGLGEGKGRLQLTFYKGTQKLVSGSGVWMELKNIKKMYQRWSANEASSSGVQWNAWPLASCVPDADSIEPAGIPQSDAEKDFILYVHGWNMTRQDKRSFAETAYKRMWQIGYKGRFGAFFWPTFYASSALDNADPRLFDGSEHRAWESSGALLELLVQLNNMYPSRVHLFAHSMGNVVASEALRKATGIVVENYVASQAAIPADVFKLNPDVTSQWNKVLAATFTGHGINLPGAKAVTTPNVYAYYYPNTRDPAYSRQQDPKMGKPYMDGVKGAAKWHNYLNPNDWALGCWIYNQSQKPNATEYPPLMVWFCPGVAVPWTVGSALTPRNYQYKHFIAMDIWGFWADELGSENDHGLYFLSPNNTYEIFSYCAQARCNPTGRQPNVGGAFTSEKNFSEFQDLHPGHSAQFLYSICERWNYWHNLLTDCNIGHINNIGRVSE